MLEGMGYQKVAGVAEKALFAVYRDDFPVTRELIYLNHAAVSPLCRPAAEAMERWTQDVSRHGSLHYGQWMETYDGLRRAAAQLIHASADEIAIVKNTSEGINTVALGLDWRPGDRVVAFQEEFPANDFPWRRLEKRGVRVSWLSIYDPLDKIAEAVRGARLLAISFVNYLSGFRVNLRAIGEVCRQHGCFFFVDAIQGLGAFPLDVELCHIDALAADGHKWMLASEGCGVLYVRRKWLDEIEPVEFGWMNPARYADYSSRDMTPKPDAGRYECGTLNTAGCFGLRAAIEFLLRIGIEEIAASILERTEQLYHGAVRQGYEALVEWKPESASGIVSFRHPSMDCRSIVSELKRNGMLAAPRQGWVRMAPHFYVSPEDIDRVLTVLPRT
jgi:cysteine desulfurase / selenocysteine lyase